LIYDHYYSETLAFNVPDMWPPNSPDQFITNLRHYAATNLPHYIVRSLYDSRQHRTNVWREMEQSRADDNVIDLCRRLHACVQARERHFEYSS